MGSRLVSLGDDCIHTHTHTPDRERTPQTVDEPMGATAEEQRGTYHDAAEQHGPKARRTRTRTSTASATSGAA